MDFASAENCFFGGLILDFCVEKLYQFPERERSRAVAPFVLAGEFVEDRRESGRLTALEVGDF